MAYNNIFPVSYPQYYPVYQQAPQPAPQPQQPQSAPQQPQGGIIWVQGEAGMKAYLVAPNSTVQLWDSERQTIYLKSADASGMPSVKVLDYTIRDQAAPAAPVAAATAPAPDYATKGDIEALSGKLNRLRADLDELSARRDKKRRDDDE